ncbi:TPA: MloB [Legionella pneumophila subsp. pneumophila]|uniref:ATP-binding protein n=1 Tax=Legionella pneumophila TaxID=446 RepID=UPI000770B54B|nr:ATP-binding protein [Legionella pneumophila]TIG87119.1 MloB [Legionella pneumophila]CZH00969.1 Divergent AAA domain [Legionella pneumophila]STX81914.1 ATP-dependent DNA helicase [Legionella pneumophila]HAT1991305.1 MloB [Legionella pneumophila]HAT1993841.1 MloB [Legionella pneumophila]
MITLELLEQWLENQPENENIEFKAAKEQFNLEKLLMYCVALSNEGGGYLVLGVSDKPPRKVLDTQAFLNLSDLKIRILDQLHFRVEVVELFHTDGRVVILEIPSRPTGHPNHYKGAYLMRAGESLVPMSQDQLRRIFSEGEPNWFMRSAKSDVSSSEVIALLDSQAFFDLLKQPYPTTQEEVLSKLSGNQLITAKNGGWIITNLAAITLAKQLDLFSPELNRKAPRVVIYDGLDKLHTKDDRVFNQGYAVCFENLVNFIHSSAPQNHYIEEVLRDEVKMFPRQALRELIANALVHQDMQMSGTSVMIEMYSDRVEISNPGLPSINIERFIDEYRSRNEILADLMRRFHICEEKGSGIDKVIHAAELYQLPAPDFRVGQTRTTSVLFAHQDFAKMSKADRVRACYQHACLQYLSNKRMSNQTLRERFKLGESRAATVSLIISETKAEGLIKIDASDTNSTRYARYLPFWA